MYCSPHLSQLRLVFMNQVKVTLWVTNPKPLLTKKQKTKTVSPFSFFNRAAELRALSSTGPLVWWMRSGPLPLKHFPAQPTGRLGKFPEGLQIPRGLGMPWDVIKIGLKSDTGEMEVWVSLLDWRRCSPRQIMSNFYMYDYLVSNYQQIQSFYNLYNLQWTWLIINICGGVLLWLGQNNDKPMWFTSDDVYCTHLQA